MYLGALARTLRSKRFWVWQLVGIVIYAIPVTIRLTTGNVILPILGLLPTPWIGHMVPANLVEKILVNAFFPGAAGAVAGEIFYSAKNNIQTLTTKQKYLYRLTGALFYVTLWSIFQLFGYLANIIGTYGTNLFEYPGVYPLNFLLSSLGIFSPDIVGYLKNKIVNLYRKPKA